MTRPDQKTAGPSQRVLRVGELIRHAAAEILSRGDIEDAALARQVVTIPSVKMSPDLKLATLYVMPLGGKDAEKTVAALERNKKTLRAEIAHRINLKFAPDLRFVLDHSFDASAKIDALLKSPAVARDLQRPDIPEEE
jgi:ribosome-binding factor A